MKKDASYWIKVLDLEPHPEGGYYKEIYRSDEQFISSHLPEPYNAQRALSTSIYFLLTSDSFSAFHRLKSDELWHFYIGAAAKIYVLDNDGSLSTMLLGSNMDCKESFCCHVKRNKYFAVEVAQEDSFALVGCTTFPGFDFSDLEIPSRKTLLEKFPKQHMLISKLSRK